MDSSYPQETLNGRKNGVQALIWLLLLLAALRIFVAVLQVPVFMSGTLGLVFSAVFLAIPIIGLFFAADFDWSPAGAVLCLIIGLIAHVPMAMAIASVPPGWPALLLTVVAQSGLILWTFGLGALVAGLFKDKNLLLPVAIFLAGFDVFLVTFPLGPVQQVLQRAPEVLAKAAYSVPRPTEAGQAVGVNVASYVGPADFIFLSMFFVALFKFRMKPQRTLPWMVLSLVAYMVSVLAFGDLEIGPVSLNALPALLPIGLVVLLANAREFKLKTEEWMGTGLVTLIAFAMAIFGITAPQPKPIKPPSETSPSAASPVELGSGAKPGQANPNPRR